MMLYKPKKSPPAPAKGNRLLINITVMGSAGPIRLVVNEGESVAAVIDSALKSYARAGRLPVLGLDLNDFFLYCPNAGSDAVSTLEKIGSLGHRNFVLCKKPEAERVGDEERRPRSAIIRKGSGSWKSWLNKSRNLKICSH